MVIKQSVASKWFEDSLCNKNFPRHGKDWHFSQKFFTTKSLVTNDLIVTYLRLIRKYFMTDLKIRRTRRILTTDGWSLVLAVRTVPLSVTHPAGWDTQYLRAIKGVRLTQVVYVNINHIHKR